MITIRLATTDDAPALARISNEIHAMHVAGRPSDFKAAGNGEVFTADRMRSLIGTPGHFVWVADSGSDVAGFAHAVLSDEPDMPWRSAVRVLELKAMGVTAAHRGGGLGVQLLDAVYGAARAHGAREIRLTVWGFNDGARRFYRRHGFVLRNEQLGRTVERDDADQAL